MLDNHENFVRTQLGIFPSDTGTCEFFVFDGGECMHRKFRAMGRNKNICNHSNHFMVPISR